MNFDFKDFNDLIKENLASCDEEYEDFIDYSPELFEVLTSLVSDKTLEKDLKIMVYIAITYFVINQDLIPDKTYGPYGYVDDLFLSSYVLEKIAEEKGYEYLNKFWKNNLNLKEVLNIIYKESKVFLDEDDIKKLLKIVDMEN